MMCFRKERSTLLSNGVGALSGAGTVGPPWMSLSSQTPHDDSGGTTGSAGFSAWLGSSASSWHTTTTLWTWWWPTTSPRDSSGGTTRWPISKWVSLLIGSQPPCPPPRPSGACAIYRQALVSLWGVGISGGVILPDTGPLEYKKWPGKVWV